MLEEFTYNFLIELTEFFDKNPSNRNKKHSSTKGSAISPRICAAQA